MQSSSFSCPSAACHLQRTKVFAPIYRHSSAGCRLEPSTADNCTPLVSLTFIQMHFSVRLTINGSLKGMGCWQLYSRHNRPIKIALSCQIHLLMDMCQWVMWNLIRRLDMRLALAEALHQQAPLCAFERLDQTESQLYSNLRGKDNSRKQCFSRGWRNSRCWGRRGDQGLGRRGKPACYRISSKMEGTPSPHRIWDLLLTILIESLCL